MILFTIKREEKEKLKEKERGNVLKINKIVAFYEKEFYIEMCERNHD